MTANAATGNPNIQMFKYIYSSILLVFCITIILGLLYTEQTEGSHDMHPVLAMLILFAAIAWLTMVEGGQGAIVGLGPVHEDFFKDTHKWSHRCTSIVHKGDNLNRYILGRQFMVILIVFVVERTGAPIEHAELWGFPNWLTNMFLVSGVAMILFTCMVGQLNSEVNGCHCMLDYINNWFALFTVYVALGIEFSGILHTSYLIQQFAAWCAGKTLESNEPPRDVLQNIFFYGRALMSVCLLVFAFIATFYALFDGKTTMWDFVPPGISVVIFLILLFIIGLLEGSQIAYFAVTKLQKCERGESYFAKKTCEILFERGDGNHNLAAFVIGRQLCVVSCMFFVARVTSIRLDDDDENIFGVSDGIQKLFETGLLGALCTAIVGSMMWRLLAAAFPIAFLSTPFTYVLLRFCLFLESTGLLHGAWVLAAIHKKVAGFHRDEFYIGTAEERAAKKHPDDQSALSSHAGNPVPLLDVGENPLEGEEQMVHANEDKTSGQESDEQV